jgi:hypothetical protein
LILYLPYLAQHTAIRPYHREGGEGPSIVAADRLARALGTTLSEMLAELEL